MAAERRTVRVSPAAFDQLDTHLPQDRGPLGEASVGDFIVLELPAVVERLASGFDHLPEIIEGTSGGRMLIAPGLLVRASVVYGVLLDDDTIEVVGISIDR
ncbi:hypothetical protein [Actinospongicola halichondriae]|uniref:hypothetical protein n=1 Tax=Actinospongicola halichondriae TaxID=3236844 RepID=UPI003D4B32F9